jgi:hypothetical protein
VVECSRDNGCVYSASSDNLVRKCEVQLRNG